MYAKSPQSCLTLCDPMDCSSPASSVQWACPTGKDVGVGCHVLLQGIFPTRDWMSISYVSCIGFFCVFFFVVVFAIHWYESAMDLYVFPIPIPAPASLSIPSLWVFPVHQPWALVSLHWILYHLMPTGKPHLSDTLCIYIISYIVSLPTEYYLTKNKKKFTCFVDHRI